MNAAVPLLLVAVGMLVAVAVVPGIRDRRHAAELPADTAEWLGTLAAKPTRAEKRTGRAYLATALGHAYVPVRRHQRRRA